MERARRPPEGTIALLFTDIEGSTRLATELGPDWPAVLAEHHELVGGAIAGEGGDHVEGDGLHGRAAVATVRRGARDAGERDHPIEVHPDEMGALGRVLLRVLVKERILVADDGADRPTLH